ncbi:Protein OS-9 [Linnemannia hyalina]|uniref:Protein OS-9 homolog n=1 Tax=Linnemannia hyalina TaxID=64524 RepID=A0A9P8BT37_9FUNG|nr:Protein OS-9 [Linnemannia hyalina]
MRIKTISPTKAAILVCATIGAVVLLDIPHTEAFSVNFVYNDLLAHPQYDVQFLEEVVPASSVASRSSTHRRQQRQAQAQIGMKKSETQDQEQQEETTRESPSIVVMTDADGMRWSCMIPPKMVHEIKAPPELTPQEIKEEERRSVQRGLELLDHLSRHCLLMKRDFWTYEYCHKRWIRQYHAVHSNGQWVPDTPENTYVLAMYQSEENNNNNQAHPDNEAALQQRSPSSSITESTVTTTELEVSNERKYLVQRWDNGDLCDLTGQPRKVEVQFQCAPFDDRIQVVTEPSTCNYIMVINSPNLCKDTAFESVPTPEANKIECRRIVSDEQYQKLKANVPEAIDGAAGIVQDHNAQIKIGQVPRQQPHQRQTQQGVGAAATGAPGTEPPPTLFTTFEDILGFAKQVNDVEAQKKMRAVLAQYEAFSESLKAMLSPEDKAVYENLENMLKMEGDLQDVLSKEGEEREDKDIFDAFFGGLEGQGKATKDAKDVFDAIFGAKETEKEPQQAKAPSTPPQHQQEAAAAATGKEQPQKQDNIKFATIDSATLLDILDAARTAGAIANANTAEEKQKQGQETSEETKEKKSHAQVKL